MRILDSMMDRFSDHVFNQISRVVDWTSDKPLTALEISTFIKAAEQVRDHVPGNATASNAHTGHYSDGNRLDALKHLGKGKSTFLQRSEARQMVFKSVEPQAPGNFLILGIQTRRNLQGRPGAADIPQNGNVVGRNIASYEIAHALGVPEMIAETHRTQQEGAEVIMMAKVPGVSVYSIRGRLDFETSVSPENIAARTAAWNQALAKHNLLVTGHTGSQVHLANLEMVTRLAKAIQETNSLLFETGLSTTITVDQHGIVQHSEDAVPEAVRAAKEYHEKTFQKC